MNGAHHPHDGATVGGDAGPDEDALDDLRAAAGAVVASLKQLADAAEKVLEDPETFAQIAASGRAVVDAFLGGFSAEPPAPPDRPTSEPVAPPVADPGEPADTSDEVGGEGAFSG